MNASESSAALPTLLGQIYLGARTGRLRLQREDGPIGLAFHRGRLVGAEALEAEGPALPLPDPEDELACHLARVLLELSIERRSSGNGGARPLSREPLLAALSGAPGDATFAEDSIEDAQDGVVTTEQLVLEAVRRLPDEAAVRAELGDLGRPVGLSINPDFDRELSPTDAYILSRVDGKLSAAEVLQLVPGSADEPERSLLGLLLTGVVEMLALAPKAAPPGRAAPFETPEQAPLAPAPDTGDEESRGHLEPRRHEIIEAYERLAQQSHFEALGVPEGATEQEIKQGFFQKAKKFHPDQYRDPGFADLADRIEALFMRVGGAYEVLRDPQSRQSYEAVLRRRRGSDAPPRGPAAPTSTPGSPSASMEALRPADNLIDTAENAWMAEEAIHRAERLIADTKTWDAIQLLQAVIPRIFGRKQRDRARVLLAKAYIKNPNWVRRGEELLQTVLQEDPLHAEAHFALGMLYKESGMSSRAVGMFKKALELRPEHKHAQAELSALSGPAFLRKLFGKG